MDEIELKSGGGSTTGSTKYEDSLFRFTDVCFSVESKDGQKNILENISAEVKSGQVLAIMGPSGAGKTTLINVSAVPR